MVTFQRLRVIYSKLQIYTHTQNYTENNYVHAQGFYFFKLLPTTFPKISSSSFFLWSPFLPQNKTFPTSGEMLPGSLLPLHLLFLLTCL